MTGIDFLAFASALNSSIGVFWLVMLCSLSFLRCNTNIPYHCDRVLGMTETPPTAPDPYDYAHPNPPDDTHLWDLYGVAQVLGLRYRTIAAGKRAMPYREKQIGRGQKTRFYSLESIIEWDKMRDTRLLDDEGRQRILTDTDGRTWVDGKRVYTIKDAAEYLDMTHD